MHRGLHAAPLSVFNARMEDADPQSEIARLEAEIEALAERIERSRKFMLAARIALIGGAAWAAAVMLGVLRLEAVGLVAAIAAVLGGFVMLGSSRTTLQQYAQALGEAEAQRRALIAGMALRVVGEGE